MHDVIPNRDHAELVKFDQLSDRWWDEDGEFKPLHEINPLRLGYIDQRAWLQGKSVLDVGCGGGILAEAMALKGARVTGIDLAERSLAAASAHAKAAGVTVDYRLVATQDLAAAAPESFDVVTCMEMLEHVLDPGVVVSACAQLVKPEGHVFFSTINRNPLAFLFAILGAEYVLRLLPKGTHEYARFIRPAELARWARDAQLDVADIAGLSYNPLTRAFRLTRDVTVNYLLHARKT
jgi:2-polyprenyl-6-hydroxyphenyl methylase / 3-demethylubiquinone-9 3-methyltransferase